MTLSHPYLSNRTLFAIVTAAAVAVLARRWLIPPSMPRSRILPFKEEEVEIDNDMYNRPEFAQTWWSKPSFFNYGLWTLQVLNPARIGFFDRVFTDKLSTTTKNRGRFLDIGCGGGISTEALARRGYKMTGVDLSEPSLDVARQHALESGLEISYLHGSAYKHPFPPSSFDGIIMSDVLEHLHDLPLAILELARVLKPGGIFCFDTLTRTWFSYLANIVMTYWAGAHAHDWRLFVKLDELRVLLKATGMFEEPVLDEQEIRGMSPVLDPASTLYVGFRETRGIGIQLSWLGWARRNEKGAEELPTKEELIRRISAMILDSIKDS